MVLFPSVGCLVDAALAARVNEVGIARVAATAAPESKAPRRVRGRIVLVILNSGGVRVVLKAKVCVSDAPNIVEKYCSQQLHQ
ncbi:hypothetical protein D3C87_1663480 [compost metagenome]